MCGHIMKRCGCLSVRLSVCLSVTCHISKTEQDRAIVTMDHYIKVGCNYSPFLYLEPPLSAPPGVRRPLKGVNRTTAYISKSCGGSHIVSIFMIDTTCFFLIFYLTLNMYSSQQISLIFMLINNWYTRYGYPSCRKLQSIRNGWIFCYEIFHNFINENCWH